MGGNTYNRKYFSDDQILDLIEYSRAFPRREFFSNRIFQNEKQWRSNVSRYLDNDSCIRFYFKYYSPQKCEGCDSILTKESFDLQYKYKFNRFCPKCTRSYIWINFETEEQKKIRGKAIADSKLRFYQTESGKKAAKLIGQKNKVRMKEFNQTEEGKTNIEKSRKFNSIIMKEKILSGSFTPKSNNRNTHWDSNFDGKKYRSSWEALYQFFFPNDLYEELRLTYEYLGEQKIYIVDFINHCDKIITEVKPKEHCSGNKFNAKVNAASEWCIKNGYKFQIVDQHFLKLLGIENIDLSQFDTSTQRKIQKLFR